ncbi:MAG: hypothetical protein ACRDHO_10230 [Actinomycetota bacterium]
MLGMEVDRRVRGLRSLDIILAEAGHERDAQLAHFDALDTKAGIILGFAGAIVALAPSGQFLLDVGRLAGVLAAFGSLSAFLPRKYEVTDIYRLRQKYLGAERAFAKLVLLDTKIRIIEQTAIVLRRKARRIKASMMALAMAALLVAFGIALD